MRRTLAARLFGDEVSDFIELADHVAQELFDFLFRALDATNALADELGHRRQHIRKLLVRQRGRKSCIERIDLRE